jgi:hypothetical protein
MQAGWPSSSSTHAQQELCGRTNSSTPKVQHSQHSILQNPCTNTTAMMHDPLLCSATLLYTGCRTWHTAPLLSSAAQCRTQGSPHAMRSKRMLFAHNILLLYSAGLTRSGTGAAVSLRTQLTHTRFSSSSFSIRANMFCAGSPQLLPKSHNQHCLRAAEVYEFHWYSRLL